MISKIPFFLCETFPHCGQGSRFINTLHCTSQIWQTIRSWAANHQHAAYKAHVTDTDQHANCQHADMRQTIASMMSFDFTSECKTLTLTSACMLSHEIEIPMCDTQISKPSATLTAQIQKTKHQIQKVEFFSGTARAARIRV